MTEDVQPGIDEYLARVNLALEEWGLVEVHRLILPSNFGNAEVRFMTEYLSLRVIRERLVFHIDLGPLSVAPAEWFGADIVLAYLAHSREERVVLPMPDQDVLEGLRQHRDDTQRLFNEKEFRLRSKVALESFQLSLRPDIAARIIYRASS